MRICGGREGGGEEGEEGRGREGKRKGGRKGREVGKDSEIRTRGRSRGRKGERRKGRQERKIILMSKVMLFESVLSLQMKSRQTDELT